MKKLILRNGLSPGDILMLTAAVRDLHRCYPGQFQTDVRTSCMELWENNPYLTPLSEDDPEVQEIDCAAPLINSSNRLPYHYVHAFIAFLNDRLGLSIRPTSFRGDIHLSPQEKAWYSQIHELAGEDIPFWIIAAGGKYDLTVKWWSRERYQQVVDHFRGRIQFVQVGGQGHFHPKLDGTIDLRGQTNLRELVRLVYHAQGVLCGVTAVMHLARAIESRPGYPRSRPCVIVAGGREPAHWEQYPDHQFISTNGTLPCCSHGGCWRSRTMPLGDGDDRDKPENLCVDVVGELPRCMDMITADEVARRISLYFDGGIARFLAPGEIDAARRAVHQSAANPYDGSALTLHNARIALQAFIRELPAPPFRFSGRGIVICGGGVRYFTGAWVCVNMLRKLGCKLPIELWHLGAREFDPEMQQLIEPLGVRCIDAREVAQKFPVRRLGGWESKPFAILFSEFAEVLYLDADNVPVVNPEFLFDTPQYLQSGAIFWPDLPTANEPHTIWESCGMKWPGPGEFESGQIVVDKRRCWEPMRLTLWFNEHSDFYYKHIHGDKETFHLAFHKLKCSYAFPSQPVKRLARTMCQHDFEGRRIFQHRNMDKWNLFLRNQKVDDFWFEAECFKFVSDLRDRWDGRTKHFLKEATFGPGLSMVEQEPTFAAFMISCGAREKLRASTVESLRATDWGDRPIHIEMDMNSSPGDSQSNTALRALEASLTSTASHIIFLEDDLEFNRHFFHNLSRWPALQSSQFALGSLYNPGLRPLAWNAPGNFTLCNTNACFGSQAFVLSHAAVKFVVARWNEVAGLQDIRISRLAGRLQPAMFYHTPSLVQHTGVQSTWGAGFHKARDFDRDWKC